MHESKISELRMTTKEAVKNLENESLDFAYIDGDHTLRGITIDLDAMFSKMKAGGFIGGDDFTRNIWQHSDEYDPTEVFPYALYFAEAKNCTIFTLPYNQFLLFKNDNFQVVDYGNYSNLTARQIYHRPSYPVLKRLIPNSIKPLIKKFISQRS